MSDLIIVPAATDLVRPEAVAALELDVRQRVRQINDLTVLGSAAERVNALAKALAGTKVAPPAMAAARRIEWRIGQVLGPTSRGKRLSVATDSGLSADDAYDFRQLATLELDWDESAAWAVSRSRLLKLARERKRVPVQGLDIRTGDFRSALSDVPADSVSLILTDPPYAQDALGEYEALGAFAAEKLCVGGSLVCYVGQSTLPGAITALSPHMRYWWCLALEHRGGGQQLPGKWVRIKWKPVLWFVKDARRDKTYVHDLIRGVKPDKELHGWAQGVDEVVPLIESLTDPGELVCDPFAGSGSFGIAATKIGRRFVGADVGGMAVAA